MAPITLQVHTQRQPAPVCSGKGNNLEYPRPQQIRVRQPPEDTHPILRYETCEDCLMSSPYKDKRYTNRPYKVRGSDECLVSNPDKDKQGHQTKSTCRGRAR